MPCMHQSLPPPVSTQAPQLVSIWPQIFTTTTTHFCRSQSHKQPTLYTSCAQFQCTNVYSVFPSVRKPPPCLTYLTRSVRIVMCTLQCANVSILCIILHINACSGYCCTLKAQSYTQLGTSHTWVKGLLPFYGLKEGNWQAECLCTPNPFLAQVLRIFKSGALLMFDLKN